MLVLPIGLYLVRLQRQWHGQRRAASIQSWAAASPFRVGPGAR